jgi:hypothetical protein
VEERLSNISASKIMNILGGFRKKNE